MGLRAVGRRLLSGGGAFDRETAQRGRCGPAGSWRWVCKLSGGGFCLAGACGREAVPAGAGRLRQRAGGGFAGPRAAAFVWRRAFGREAARRGVGGGFADPRRRPLSGGGLAAGKRPVGELAGGLRASGGGFWLAGGLRPGSGSGGAVRLRRGADGGFAGPRAAFVWRGAFGWEAARRRADGGVAGSRAAAFVWRGCFRSGSGPAEAGELVIWCPCADSRRVGAERAAPRRRAEAVRSGHCGRGLRGAGRGGRGVRALPSRWGTAAFAIQAKGRPRRRKDRSVFKVRVWGEKIPFTQPAESGGLLQKNATLPGISQKKYRKFTVYSQIAGICRRPAGRWAKKRGPAGRPVFQKRSGRKPERSHPAPKDTPFATRE